MARIQEKLDIDKAIQETDIIQLRETISDIKSGNYWIARIRLFFLKLKSLVK